MRTAWLNDVRSNNSRIRVVPRFLFDKFQPIQINRLLTNVIEREECVRTVRNFVLVSARGRVRARTRRVQRNKFDGAVIELWTSVMGVSQGAAAG